jgi:hypothetical protein
MPIEILNGITAFSPPGRITREKMRATSFLSSCKEGMTTPIRLPPASRRALAHCAAASISCFAESKAARETVPDRGSGLQKAISVPSASRNSFACGGRMSNA